MSAQNLTIFFLSVVLTAFERWSKSYSYTRNQHMLWGTQLFFSSLALEVFYSSFLSSAGRAVHRASPCLTSGSVSLELGWLHFGHDAEPQLQVGTNAWDAAEKQDNQRPGCGFFSWLCHFCITSDKSEKNWYVSSCLQEKKRKKSEGEEHRKDPGKESEEERSDMAGKGQPRLRVWQGRAAQRTRPGQWMGTRTMVIQRSHWPKSVAGRS